MAGSVYTHTKAADTCFRVRNAVVMSAVIRCQQHIDEIFWALYLKMYKGVDKKNKIFHRCFSVGIKR